MYLCLLPCPFLKRRIFVLKKKGLPNCRAKPLTSIAFSKLVVEIDEGGSGYLRSHEISTESSPGSKKSREFWIVFDSFGGGICICIEYMNDYSLYNQFAEFAQEWIDFWSSHLQHLYPKSSQKLDLL